MEGLMVTAVCRAFVAAGVDRETAEAAAEAVPARDIVATQEDIANVRRDIAELKAEAAEREARLVKWGVALVALAVALNIYLQWAIR